MLFENKYRIPERVIWWILAGCAVPVLLNAFGFYFGISEEVFSPYRVMKMFEFEHEETIRSVLKGRTIHTIFVSFSIAIALMTIVLAFVDFYIKGDVSTPIVGVALFSCGLMEAFHLLVSTRLLNLPTRHDFLTSYSLLFSNGLHALFLVVGTGMFLVRRNYFREQFRRKSKRFVYVTAAVFVGITLLSITLLLLVVGEDQAIVPFRKLSGRYELIPMAMYIFAGLYVFPRFYTRYPSIFSQALMLSIIPAIASQFYMSFGSNELFDNQFNISQLMMAFSYFIPFAGLAMNYVQTHRNEKRVIAELNVEAGIRRNTEENLAGVLNSALSGIGAFVAQRDREGKIVDFIWILANPAMEEFTGRKADEVIGKGFLETFPYAAEEGFLDLMIPVVLTGEPLNLEHFSERQQKWFLLFGTRLHDGITIAISDISRRKNAVQELMKSEKLAVAGRIARTIAHEVRNPLTNINLAVQQLGEETESGTGDQGLFLDIIRRNSDRINQLITELMNSSRPAEMDIKVVPVNRLLDETLDWAIDRIRLKGIRLERDYGGDELRVRADTEKMKTALLNIILNAVEAMPASGGVLTLRSFVSGTTCCIEIEDNGHGISRGHLEKLFDPFFSVKEKGMGLGLTATQNIILNHEGHIDVKSEPGKGTCFTITLDRVI